MSSNVICIHTRYLTLLDGDVLAGAKFKISTKKCHSMSKAKIERKIEPLQTVGLKLLRKTLGAILTKRDR